ncbi:MAG: hypothetical protein NXY57DRAFT_949196 [Lentinula lateritia]|nr:MAG: hypothetical protein NXY57DRAFT_949196 [Lentinula lateritia]
MFRVYTQYPTFQPDEFISLDEYCDAPTFNKPSSSTRDPDSVFGSKESSQDAPESPYAPFANPSIYHMMKYAYGENAEGLAAAQKINDDVIQQPCFDPRDLIGFNAQKEAKKLDAYQSHSISTPSQSKFPFENHSGWTRSSVNISLPCAGARNPEDKAPKFKVDGVIHRDLLSVMQEAYTGDGAAEFHLRGFKQMWNREGHAQPIRIYGEVYTSDAYLTMEKEVLVSPLEPGCDLERVIVPIMAYSDSTHLASFGSASLWPGYLWFGSQSKYSRAKPSKFSAHHLVYFPSLPKKVEDAYKKQFGTAPTDSVKTHLKRELHSEIWKLLLTPEFIDAYTNGIVVEGPDGILRRLYPRIFTYSADYPEKYIFLSCKDPLVLLASIKNLGTHLCPRCTTRKDQAWEIGTREDMTRRKRLPEEFDTRPLPREVAAASRRKANAQAKGKDQPNVQTPKPKQKLFNMNTYKFHALGDYPWTIRTFGTTDSYSTQLGELEHRRVKRFYARTNRNQFSFQIARHEHRRRTLQMISKQKGHQYRGRVTRSQVATPSLSFSDSDPLPFTNPMTRYHMSSSTRYFQNLTVWLGELRDDPAFTDFLPKLKNHILERILGVPDEGREFSDKERRTITIQNNRIYQHKVIRFNYTSYDMRRNQDSCNPQTHADIMLISGDAEDRIQHPYWFARIIGVFHINIVHSGLLSKSHKPQKFNILYVRWFGRVLEQEHYGIHVNRMPKLGFIDAVNPEAFGFVDPSEVLRGCHIIPAFEHGKTDQFLIGPSLARHENEDNEDFFRFYVNMWADRDMFMRFRGGGVGHKSTLDATRIFETQNDIPLSDKDIRTPVSVPNCENDGDDNDEEEEEVYSVNNDDDDNDYLAGAEDGEDEGEDEIYEGFAEY